MNAANFLCIYISKKDSHVSSQDKQNNASQVKTYQATLSISLEEKPKEIYNNFIWKKPF